MLFHVTYDFPLEKIKKEGLVINSPSYNFDGIVPGIYFSNLPLNAFDYADTAENVPDGANIIILAVDEMSLNAVGRFFSDHQMIVSDVDSIYSIVFDSNILPKHLFIFDGDVDEGVGTCRSICRNTEIKWNDYVDPIWIW